MRVLIVLCLVAVACADKLGYNYQPVEHSNGGLSFTPGNVGGVASQDVPSFVAPSDSSNSNYGTAPVASVVEPSSTGSVAAPSTGEASYAAPVELQKEFFTFTADEGDFAEPISADQVSNNLKKALRVIFIKGPENHGLEDAALALAKQSAQQETAIYVLNKQADIGDLANKLNSIGSNKSNKPEVHFVKYRTPEDAANAQNAIQGQYDQLGGHSNVQNGGVASVLNFASQPARHASAPVASSPDNSYLPASVFRRFV